MLGYAIIEVIKATNEAKKTQEASRLCSLKYSYEEMIRNINEIIKNVVKCRTELLNARREFENGGYVYDNTPLANKEFTECISEASEILNLLYDSVGEFNQKIDETQAALNKLYNRK